MMLKYRLHLFWLINCAWIYFRCEGQDDIPLIVASSILPLTRDKLKLISFAAKLSEISFNEHDAISMGAQYYATKIDAIVTYETSSYCFVAFRGSEGIPTLTMSSFEDWVYQNFDFKYTTVTKRSNTNIGCLVHNGFAESYAGVGVKNINRFIDSCMRSGKKQLVFTGHSQGGAASGIAAIIHADYNPLTITFGQPPFLKSDSCDVINADHFWRIINTENSFNGLQYDPIPFATAMRFVDRYNLVGSHVGSSIILPPNSEGDYTPDPQSATVVYRSTSQTDPYIGALDLDILPGKGRAFSAHRTQSYVSKIIFLISNGEDPIFVDGFIVGTQCQVDFECQEANRQCFRNICGGTLASNGEKCGSDNECESGKCSVSWSLNIECQNKARGGSVCFADDDCESGNCKRWKLCA